MSVENVTASRSYQLPYPDNDLSFDVGRIIAAINGLDVDVATLIASLSGKAATTHTHAIADVAGLQAALDGKVGTGTELPIAQVTSLQAALDAKAPINNAAFTGTTTGVSPSAGANNTQFATTAWVRTQGYLTAVATANITDGAVTETKIAAGAITEARIATGAVTTGKIGDAAVTPVKMSNGAAVSVLGRSANSSGMRADIGAAANGGILSRLSDALGFNTLSAVLDAVVSAVRGALLWRSATCWTALPIGASGTVLSSDGTDVSWQPPSAGGFTTAGAGLTATNSTTVAINTNNTLGVGAYVIAKLSGGIINSGSTVSAASLLPVYWDSTGTMDTGGSAMAGTWRNVSGAQMTTNTVGLWIRTA